jgi:Fibronectin type III domain
VHVGGTCQRRYIALPGHAIMSSTQRTVATCAMICITSAHLILCACARQAPTSSSLPPQGNSTATLSWEPPRRNLDGSTIGNLAGYFIYYGRSPTNLNVIIKIPDPYVTTYTVDRLSPGTYYFRIVAFTDTGINGSASPTVSKTIR